MPPFNRCKQYERLHLITWINSLNVNNWGSTTSECSTSPMTHGSGSSKAYMQCAHDCHSNNGKQGIVMAIEKETLKVNNNKRFMAHSKQSKIKTRHVQLCSPTNGRLELCEIQNVPTTHFHVVPIRRNMMKLKGDFSGRSCCCCCYCCCFVCFVPATTACLRISPCYRIAEYRQKAVSQQWFFYAKQSGKHSRRSLKFSPIGI